MRSLAVVHKQRFFISFNSRDQPIAEWIAWVLRDAGHEVAIHTWEMGPGGDIPNWMNRRLAWADRLIAVMSPDYAVAVYSAIEWTAMVWRDPDGESNRVIPVLVRPTPEIPPLLSTRSRIDLTQVEEPEAIRRLLRGVDQPLLPYRKPAFEQSAPEKPSDGADRPPFEPGKPTLPTELWVGSTTLGDWLVNIAQHVRSLLHSGRASVEEPDQRADYLENVGVCLHDTADKLWRGRLAREECETLRVHLDHLRHVVLSGDNDDDATNRLHDQLYMAIGAPAKVIEQLTRSAWALVGNPMQPDMPRVVGIKNGLPVSLSTGEDFVRNLARLHQDPEFEPELDLGKEFIHEIGKIEAAAGAFRAMAEVLRHG